MSYIDFARGVQLDDRHEQVDAVKLRKADFAVVYAGAGSADGGVAKRSLRFTQHLAECQNAGIPVLAFIDCVADIYRGISFEDESRMPKPENDGNMKVLLRQLKSGAALRYVHGIIINLNWLHVDGSNPSAAWMKKIYEHLSGVAWQLFKLPVWYYVDKRAIEAYPGENPFTTWLDNIKTFCSWESAYLDAPETVRADWNYFPVPDDTDNLHLARGTGWNFWKYANTKFVFDGISGAGGAAATVPLWLFAGAPEKLYGELPGFVPAAPGEPEPQPEPEPEEPEPLPPSTSALVKALDAFCTAWLAARKVE
jgi:hypothetical protein